MRGKEQEKSISSGISNYSGKTDAFDIVAEKENEKTPFEEHLSSGTHDENGDYLTIVSFFIV